MNNSAYRPIVFICSTFSGDEETNVIKAREYSRFALENSTIPIAPHLLFPQFMDDKNPQERELAMHFNYVLLGKCQELWVFGTKISSGMNREILIAAKRKMRIRYFNESCEEVKSNEGV